MPKKHDHSSTANSQALINSFHGETFFGDYYWVSDDREIHSYVLVFECGYGLTFGDNGSFWVKPPHLILDNLRVLVEENERMSSLTKWCVKLSKHVKSKIEEESSPGGEG